VNRNLCLVATQFGTLMACARGAGGHDPAANTEPRARRADPMSTSTSSRNIGLEEAKEIYSEARARFRPSAEHLVPDIALLGFLRDVEENAQAVEILAASKLPHRGYPNARAAYEASQRAILLATSPDYDLDGAKAWVYYLRRDRNYLALPRSSAPAQSPSDPEAWFDGSLDEMAQVWESLAPGKGKLLRRALAELPGKKVRAENWAGVAIVPTIRDRLNALFERGGKASRGDTSSVYNAAYGGLSRQSHPSARLELSRVLKNDQGQIALEERPRDPVADAKGVRLSAASSYAEAYLALDLRLKMP
jgi:hypothetical protein